MKQKLWIFGDSYSDPVTNNQALNPWQEHVVYHKGWSHWLKKDYDIENFAHTGLSADTCFLQLCEKVDYEKHDLENISVLFACPNFLSRIVLTGYENSKSWAFKYMAYPRKEFIKTISKMGLNKQQISYFGNLHDTYHEFAKVFITEFMETNEYKNRLNAIMGALDCYAKHFKRFIFIPVGDISGWTKPKPANHFQNMTVRDDINFTKLSQQSEMPDDDEMFKFLTSRATNINDKDPMYLYPNHLDANNSQIIYDIVKGWMDKIG